jgi:hypothetical protein
MLFENLPGTCGKIKIASASELKRIGIDFSEDHRTNSRMVIQVMLH